MNRLNFPVSVAILSILILSQYDHALGSLNTKADRNNIYKHDALIRHYVSHGNSIREGLCSGSIISDQHVLTAAHCVLKPSSNEIIDINDYLIEVVVGIEQVNDTSLQTVRAVETIFLPYRYKNKQNPRRNYGDIAVLKVNKEFGLTTNSRIKALRLPSTIGSPNEEQSIYQSMSQLTTTGFGLLGYKKIRNRQNEDETRVAVRAHYLYYSSAAVIEHNYCDYSSSTSNVKLCVEIINDEKLDSTNCVGDAGGALFDAMSSEIIGVASSYSKNCDTKNFSVYTRVSAFIDIIEAAVNHDKAILCKSRRISFKGNQSYREKVKDERYSKFYSDINPYRRPIPDRLPSRRDTLPSSTYNG